MEFPVYEFPVKKKISKPCEAKIYKINIDLKKNNTKIIKV